MVAIESGSHVPSGHAVSVRHKSFDPEDPRQLEQLKIACQLHRDYAPCAERLVRARVRANWQYLRLNLTAVGGIALFLKVGLAIPPRTDVLHLGGLGLTVLLLINLQWALNIMSITRQATRTYRVIKAMEALMPVRPHTAEWDLAGRGKNVLSYLPRWIVELGMPTIASLAWVITYAEIWPR